MQTAAPAPASVKVGATLPAYAGPLDQFLQCQADATAEAQRQSTLRSMRVIIRGLVEEPQMFSADEQARTLASLEACQCVAQLQRWFRNVYRLLKYRESALGFAVEEGTYTSLSLAA